MNADAIDAALTSGGTTTVTDANERSNRRDFLRAAALTGAGLTALGPEGLARAADAVAIATPDHWHAPAAIMACGMGKHVYVEKPCCHNPREGELLIEAARKNKRHVQHGTQRRSWPKNVEAIARLKAGEFGKVLFSR